MSEEFLPNLKSNVMEELLVTEGMLFKDECAKLFYMEIKKFIFENLYNIWKK